LTPLRGGADRPSASRRELPFGFVCRFWDWRFSRLLECSPTLPLCFGDPGAASGAHLPALTCRRLRRGGGFAGITGERPTKLCNLSVDILLLRLEAFNGCGNNIVR